MAWKRSGGMVKRCGLHTLEAYLSWAGADFCPAETAYYEGSYAYEGHEHRAVVAVSKLRLHSVSPRFPSAGLGRLLGAPAEELASNCCEIPIACIA